MTEFERLIDQAHDLASTVTPAVSRIDNERRIPEDVIRPIIEAGFFRLLLPRSLGGSELAHPDFLKIVRIFAEADASVGWCINQNNVFSTNAVRVSRSVAEEIWGNPKTVVTNGPPRPGTKAVKTNDGYRLTGIWDFSSGISHATWVAALTPVHEPNGTLTKEMRIFLIPKSKVEIIDQWFVGGLRGTASLSFKTEDLFVPTERSYGQEEPSSEPGPLYVIHTTPMFASGFATVALGVARTALNFAIDLTKRKTIQGATELLSADTTTHRMIGEVEASWNAARTFLDEATSNMWQTVTETHQLPNAERIQVRLAGTHAIRTSADVVNSAYNICGSTAIFDTNIIQRCFQDAHAIRQQIQGRPNHYDTAGQFYLGLDPKGIF